MGFSMYIENLCAIRRSRVLDDIEMYDDQKLFKLEDYVQISGFLNTFVYKIISNNLIGMSNKITL